MPSLRTRIKIFRQKMSRSAPVLWVASMVIAGYICFVHLTSRRISHIPEASKTYMAGAENCIFAFWHGRLLMAPSLTPKGKPMNVLVSRHNDGEIIASSVRRMGINTVRGSSGRGGDKAGIEIIKRLSQGENIGITPDGPRGPNRKAQPGVIQLARLSGATIIPLSASSSRHKMLDSWDKMQLILPFSRLSLSVGEPVHIPADSDDTAVKAYQDQLEAELNRLTRHADAMIGLDEAYSSASAAPRKRKPR